MLGPGLRTGWIAAPEAVLARINLVKQGADLCGSAFDQLVVQHYFADVAWQRTLQKFIALYKERRDAMLAALDEFFPPEATWTHPAGFSGPGFVVGDLFIWGFTAYLLDGLFDLAGWTADWDRGRVAEIPERFRLGRRR